MPTYSAGMIGEPTVSPAPADDPGLRALMAELDAELTGHYPDPADRHGDVGVAEIAAGAGVFLLARVDGVAVGCGGLRVLDGGTGEIKRMYVAPAGRGAGIGRRLLTELEALARELDLRRLVLETGDLLTDAVRLYTRAGFTPIPRYGPYADSPASLCLGKALD